MFIQHPIIDKAISILKRRRWYFLVPFLALFCLSIGVILMLPTSYVSEGMIGVESQQIPEDFVRSTITTHAGQRVGMIEARVMTSASLQQIIEHLQLYSKDWDSKQMPTLVGRLADRTSVNIIRDPYAGQLGAIAFSVTFEDEDPEMARAVTAELVNLFLEENVSTRTERAAETTEFLEREAERLGELVRTIDLEMAEFKQTHRNALPEHLSIKISMMNRLETDLRAVESEISAIQQERLFLNSRIASNSSTTEGSISQSSSSPTDRLTELKMEMAVKSEQYLPAHPEMRLLADSIKTLEDQIAREDALTDDHENDKSKVGPTTISTPRNTITNQLNLLRSQQQTLRDDIDKLQREILEIPLVEIELRRLTDQYQLHMDAYNNIRVKKYDATLALSLEQEQKAERFILLEPPNTPLEPKNPLLKLVAIALLFSIAGGVGIAYLSELLDNRIYGSTMLVSLTGQQPLAVIPYIKVLPAIEASTSSGHQFPEHGNQAA